MLLMLSMREDETQNEAKGYRSDKISTTWFLAANKGWCDFCDIL